MHTYQFPKIFPVTCHTEYVGEGSTFVAIKGVTCDGVQYITQALDRGATTLVLQYDACIAPNDQKKIQEQNVVVQRVDNARRALSILSAEALYHPARQLKIIGITGTKGKTTVAFLIEHILRTAGYATALLSTVGHTINGMAIGKNLTTPQPDYLHMFFAESVRLGIEYVVMEVSAQSLTLDRVFGIEFDGIIFTNFSQEHAEFYSSLSDYFKAKCLLFKQLKSGAPCIVNADDAWYNQLQDYMSDTASCTAISLQHKNGVGVAVLKNSFHDGLSISIHEQGRMYSVACPSLVGTFNAYNVAMALALLNSFGISYDFSNNALATFGAVPGRMQRHILPNNAVALIDYAHTASSFQAFFETVRPCTKHLIVVFGAGGNRDKTKRPDMGKIAAQYADSIILTTDNPRNENPEDIIHDIFVGIPEAVQHKVVIVLDREQAIKKAYQLSTAQTVIALLGKGPDEYQEVAGVKRPFSERSLLLSL